MPESPPLFLISALKSVLKNYAADTAGKWATTAEGMARRGAWSAGLRFWSNERTPLPVWGHVWCNAVARGACFTLKHVDRGVGRSNEMFAVAVELCQLFWHPAARRQVLASPDSSLAVKGERTPGGLVNSSCYDRCRR